MDALELFAGAGGLALGISNAGFNHLGVIEWDHDACESMRFNKRRRIKHVSEWPIHEADVTKVKFSEYGENIDLLAGGVPCQPWSQGGKHAGQNDQRNLFPHMIRAVRETKPKVVLIENVKGLLRESFSTYFEYITLSLSHPEIKQKPHETWQEHLAKLEQHHTSGRSRGLEYKVTHRLLNAADYGIPQRRERVFIVAFRSDLGLDWSFPDPTHSADSLFYSQWITGDYWKEQDISQARRPVPNERIIARARKFGLFEPTESAWNTVRSALHNLPDPNQQLDSRWKNHTLVPGARSYVGHTGSPLDEPAKTLKAGDHGVPGGENTLAHPDGKVRYFTIREAARLQTFPDTYSFPGSWTESMRQLGNAVPVKLAQILAIRIQKHLSMYHAQKGTRLIA